MSMKLLLALVPIMLLAAACGGGDGEAGDALLSIERLDLEDVELQPSDLFEPSFPNPYPDVVATVNGEEIAGEALVFQQVSFELGRQRILALGAPLQDPWMAGIEPTDPLEALIDDALLGQAVVRLGLLPTYQEAVEYTRKQEETALIVETSSDPGLVEEAREFRRLSGFPMEDWASDDDVVKEYRKSMGMILLRAQECGRLATPTPPGFTGSFGVDCTEFLASEREDADIEYFVVWAE